jgi:hypothetical protein
VDLFRVDREAGERVVHVMRGYAELTPEERIRVQALAPRPTLRQAERAVDAVWTSSL